MKASKNAVSIIKRWEGIRDGNKTTPNYDPYLCPANVATIGYGHAVTDGGKMLKGQAGLKRAQELYPQGITLDEAETLLMLDMAWAEAAVNKGVQASLTQNQFDALVSFVFNVGRTAFMRSTLLASLNGGRFDVAASEFLKWNKVTKNGEKVEMPGLTNRRADEQSLFLK